MSSAFETKNSCSAFTNVAAHVKEPCLVDFRPYLTASQEQQKKQIVLGNFVNTHTDQSGRVVAFLGRVRLRRALINLGDPKTQARDSGEPSICEPRSFPRCSWPACTPRRDQGSTESHPTGFWLRHAALLNIRGSRNPCLGRIPFPGLEHRVRACQVDGGLLWKTLQTEQPIMDICLARVEKPGLNSGPFFRRRHGMSLQRFSLQDNDF